MNLEQLEKSGDIIYSVVAGSHLYGLNIEGSDTDIRGIFNMPLRDYVLPNHTKQINDDTNDTVYYEVTKFLELAKVANPNILELLFAPADKALIHHPTMDIILRHRDKFLTKATKNSLAGYAIAQIKKARGMKKMIVNPVETRKSPLDFCYVHDHGSSTIPLTTWLEKNNLDQSMAGLACVNNFTNTYAVYNKDAILRIMAEAQDFYDEEGLTDVVNNWYPKGFVKPGDISNELRLTSIPKMIAERCKPLLVSYNKDGYTVHCRNYKQYQEWVAKRNPVRYEGNQKHGKGYDSKNMMHCVRLLRMGTELAETGKLNVYRADREELLKIRSGDLEYDELLDMADSYIEELDAKFDKSGLPASVPTDLIESIIREIKLK